MKRIIFPLLLIIISGHFSCSSSSKLARERENEYKIIDDHIVNGWIRMDLTGDTITPKITDKTAYSPAKFPGGNKKRIIFLAENLVYPKKAKEFDKDGTVFVHFNIEKDGSITNIFCPIEKGYNLEHEAVRVIRLMPNWIPAKYNGEAVRSKHVLPVKFMKIN